MEWLAIAFGVYFLAGWLVLAYYAVFGARGQAMPDGCWTFFVWPLNWALYFAAWAVAGWIGGKLRRSQ